MLLKKQVLYIAMASEALLPPLVKNHEREATVHSTAVGSMLEAVIA